MNAPLHPRMTAIRAVLAAAFTLITAIGPAGAAGNSAAYRFEPNKWLALDLAVTGVQVEQIKFHWPSTMMGIKTGYKATVRVKNGSVRQIGLALAVALYDKDARLLGAGTTATRVGTIDPGDAAEFEVDFNHTTQRLEQASQFHILLEIG